MVFFMPTWSARCAEQGFGYSLREVIGGDQQADHCHADTDLLRIGREVHRDDVRTE
jgi:hypothetical protein